MKTITLVAFDKFTGIDVFLIWDLFNRVVRLHNARFSHDWEVKIVGTAPRHASITGMDLDMQGTVRGCNTADEVFFSSSPGTRALIKEPRYLKQSPSIPNDKSSAPCAPVR